MNNMVVFISASFDSKQFEKIATIMHAHNIAVTTNKALATIILDTIPKLDELSHQKIDELMQQYSDKCDIPTVEPPKPIISMYTERKPYSKYNRVLNKYDSAKRLYKQKFFNRTMCK